MNAFHHSNAWRLSQMQPCWLWPVRALPRCCESALPLAIIAIGRAALLSQAEIAQARVFCHYNM
jgi:hypothetical protein